MNSTAFVISCKESVYINDCVRQINNIYDNVDIIIVDSSSLDKKYFELRKKFSNIFIEDIFNKNYEYGAIVNGFLRHQKYQNYVFIQDSILIKSKITEIDYLKNDEVYIFGDSSRNSGWLKDPRSASYFYAKNILIPIILGEFLICQWNSFVINNKTFAKVLNSEIFLTTEPPHNKLSSCAWERVWSIIFMLNNITIKCIENSNKYSKVFGNRQ